MKVLILEDESRAANQLERVLKNVAPEAVVVGKLETIEEAVNFLNTKPSPDLVLSDIQLADGLSFEIFAQVQLNCPIVFTTAYDQYAIEAFRTNGIDYLLKPVSEERLTAALGKLRRLSPQVSLADLMGLVQPAAQVQTYKSRFLVKVGDEIKSIPISEIRAFFSLEKATFLLTNQGRRYVLDQTMDQVERQLEPVGWFRISRKYIVGFQSWDHIYAWTNSRFKLVLKGIDDQEVIVSRDRVSGFKEWLGE